MHAHINIWQTNEAGASGSDSLARAVSGHLRQQPGFHAYTIVRTGEREVVAVTLFETSSQLHDAFASLPDDIMRNIRQLSSGEPQRRQGDVLLHEHVGE